jgi:hypothetical protein
MKKELIILILLFSNNIFSQIYRRLENETVPEFTERNKPNLAYLEKMQVSTDLWNKTKNPIIAFYSNSEKSKIIGYVFVQFTEDQYSRICIGEYATTDSEDFNIENLFFANADSDSEDELVLIISQKSINVNLSGRKYNVYFYDNPNINSSNLLAINLNEKFPQEFDGIDENGKVVKTKYSSPKNIFKKLRKIDFKKASW